MKSSWLMNSAICLINAFASVHFNSSIVNGQTTEADKSVSIRVVDSSKKAITAVEGFWFAGGKAKRIVDQDGTVQVDARRGLVAVRREGFQYGGIVLDGNEIQERSIVLLRDDESARPRVTSPVPIDEADRNKLREVVINLLREQLTDAGEMNTQGRSLSILGEFDSKWAMNYLATEEADPRVVMATQQNAAGGLASTDPEAALAIVDSVEEPMFRALAFSKLLKRLPPESPLRSTCEEEWVRTIETIPEPQLRLAVWASVAEYYQQSKRPDQARKIIDVHLGEVEKLPSGGWAAYPRSLFAALIVNDEPERADRLVAVGSGNPDHEENRALARLAFHCCQQNPQRAVKYLEQISTLPNQVIAFNNHTLVAQWMAAKQPQAAIELAKSIEEPQQRAWALGLVSRRIRAENPELARDALLEAESIVLAAVPKSDSRFSPATIMAGLLPIAEEVAPHRVEPMIWEAVWLALPRSRFSGTGISRKSIIQDTSAGIARYDRKIAFALLGENKIEIASDFERVVASQIILKPDGLGDLLKEIDTNLFSGSLHPHKTALKMLTGSDSDFWNRASLPAFFQWESDQFENFE